jgi:dTDP-4-dehydrorhamnose reductase
MKVAVVGATGQLGSDICEILTSEGQEVVGLGHDQVDIGQFESVREVLAELRPGVVINTAAYHQVEKCEENPRKAFEVNAIGARNLALVCRDLDSYLIHISTDYVFDGEKKKPYLETDLPSPLNVYGNSKNAGDLFTGSLMEKALVMRTSGLYGRNPCRAKGGLNFVQLMLKLGKEREEVRVVDNEVLTPTSTLELARQIEVVVRQPIYGVAHATAEGSCSWYEFARAIFDMKGIETTLNVAGPDEFPAKVPRPSYSVLENSVLKANGIHMFKHWKEGLQEYIENFS